VKERGRRTGERAHRSAPGARRPGTATAFLLTIVVLNLLGLVMVMSASSVTALESQGSSFALFNRQLVFCLLGAATFVFMSRVEYGALRRWSAPLLAVTVTLLFLVFVPSVGVHASGSSRWIALGPFNLQPSELAKLALLVYVADVLSRRGDHVDDWQRALKPVLLVFGGVAFIVMQQPDMGTTMVVAMIVITLLFVGGVSMRNLGPLVAGGAFVAVVAALSAPYRRARVLAFLDPFADPERTGYQAVQSLIALGSGGLFGIGLGAGRAKWLFLPNAHTDFIFAIIGEELGLVGAFFVVALFVALAVLGFRIAVSAPDRFGFLLAVGGTVWIVGQAVINIGAAIGLLPITGVPLPFVSFGGTALITTMAAGGVLFGIARRSVGVEARATVAGRTR
jgi:cell division protein FtsW